MKLTITLLTLASGVLPAWGIWLIWRDVEGRRRELRRRLDTVKEIMADPALSSDERSRRLSEETPSESTWSDVLHIRERIELQGLEQAPDLNFPALLAAVGLVSGVTAGLLSTWFG